MDPSTRGSFRLFRAGGIDVYLHWSWLLVAWLMISLSRPEDYQLGAWRVIEYVSLFSIVLLHEFGHALACRSVGGEAHHIVLWPLGGIAYVAPPPRPGAVLWSIAAGPLVNLVLVLPLFILSNVGTVQDWQASSPDLYLFIRNLSWINGCLLVFNLLPIYPLDGGQIVQALLWFVLDRWRSLLVVSLVGLIIGGCSFFVSGFLFLAFALIGNGVAAGFGMLSFIAAFVALRSLISFQQSRGMLMLLALPRHENCRCPNCGAAPPEGTFWVCEHCQTRFDLFTARGKCPGCGAWYLHPDCPYCRETHHIDHWFEPVNGQPVTPAAIPSVVDQHPAVAPPNPEGGSLP